jgi:hypothetical protein
MRPIAINSKTTQAAQPWAICDSRFAAHTPVFAGSMVLSLFDRQYGMNT